MKNFKKLKKCGSIVYVPHPKKEEKIVHGYNLNSPNMTMKNYSEDKFDHEWAKKSAELKKADIIKAFNSMRLSSHFMYETIEMKIFPEKFPVPSPYSSLSNSSKKSKVWQQ